MKIFRHLPNVTTLSYDATKCIGCGICAQVCPHGVFEMRSGQAFLVDRNGCMECGACALNCEGVAITVKPGVGCASYIMKAWLGGKAGGCC